MQALFSNLLTASFHGSIVILAVMLLRVLLKKAPRKFICFLWLLAGLRLLMPFALQSSLSLQPLPSGRKPFFPSPQWERHLSHSPPPLPRRRSPLSIGGPPFPMYGWELPPAAAPFPGGRFCAWKNIANVLDFSENLHIIRARYRGFV